MTPLDTSGALSELPEETQRLAIAAQIVRERRPEGWLQCIEHGVFIDCHAPDGHPWVHLLFREDRWCWGASTKRNGRFEKAEGDGPTVEWAFDEAIAFIRSKEGT